MTKIERLFQEQEDKAVAKAREETKKEVMKEARKEIKEVRKEIKEGKKQSALKLLKTGDSVYSDMTLGARLTGRSPASNRIIRQGIRLGM